MNKPITYKHVLIVLAVIVLGMAIHYTRVYFRNYTRSLIEEGYNNGLEAGYEQAIVDCVGDEPFLMVSTSFTLSRDALFYKKCRQIK